MQPVDLKLFYMIFLALFSVVFTLVGLYFTKKAVDNKDNNAGGIGAFCFLGVAVMVFVMGNVAGVILQK